MLVSSGDNIMTSSHLVLPNSLVLLAFNHVVVKEAGFMDNIDKCFQSSVVYWKTKALLYDEERCFSQTNSQQLWFANMFPKHLHAQRQSNFHFHLCNVEKAWSQANY